MSFPCSPRAWRSSGYIGNDEMHTKFERVRANIAEVNKGPKNGTPPWVFGFRTGMN